MIAKRYVKRIYHAMRSKYLWLVILLNSPILALAGNAPPVDRVDFLKLSQNTARVGFGTPISSYFWWLGLIIEAMAVITVIVTILHILSMSRDDKEHHGVVGKWVTVLICLAISVGLWKLLFSGIEGVEKVN